MVFPRRTIELSGQSLVQYANEADSRDYDAIAAAIRTPKALPFVTVGSDAGCDYVTDGSADDVQINLAISELSSGRIWQETVWVKGNLTIAAPILLDAYTDLVISGKISFADGVDNSMFENNGDLSYGFVSVRGFGLARVAGNGANQAANSHCFNINGNNKFDFKISDIRIDDFRGYGLNLSSMGWLTLDNVRVTNSNGGLNGSGVYDSNISKFNVSGTAPVDDTGFQNILLDYYCQANSFTDLYIGGISTPANALTGIYLFGAHHNNFINTRIYDCTGHGIWLVDSDAHYCFGNTFTGGTIGNALHPNGSKITNTYDGVRLTGNSHHNTFSNISIESASSGIHRLAYNWHEAHNTCNYNTIVGGSCIGSETGTILIQGAQSTKTAVLEA